MAFSPNNKYLGNKYCDEECSLCACSTSFDGFGYNREHCSGNGICKVTHCNKWDCFKAKCTCNKGWVGDKCERPPGNFIMQSICLRLRTANIIKYFCGPCLLLFCILGCHLDANHYMPAKLLTTCLNQLSGLLEEEDIQINRDSNEDDGDNTKRKPIEYIETHYGKEDYLDNVCRFMKPSYGPYIYDKKRTEAQPDACVCKVDGDCDLHYMYPSDCKEYWLDCQLQNGCSNKNYKGFYCKGTYKHDTQWKQIKVKILDTCIILI